MIYYIECRSKSGKNWRIEGKYNDLESVEQAIKKRKKNGSLKTHRVYRVRKEEVLIELDDMGK